MLGEGKIGDLTKPLANSLANAVSVEGKYPYLYDKATKNWTASKTVRNVSARAAFCCVASDVAGCAAQVFVMGSGGINKTEDQTNAWMNGGIGHKGSIGPASANASFCSGSGSGWADSGCVVGTRSSGSGA